MEKESFPCILIFIILSFKAAAQPHENPIEITGRNLLRLHYTNSSGEEGVSVFNYSPDEKLTKGSWYLRNGKRNSVNFYTLNETGRIVDTFRIFSDSMTSQQSFEYNERGQSTFIIYPEKWRGQNA